MQNKFRLKRHSSKKHTVGDFLLQIFARARSLKSKDRARQQKAPVQCIKRHSYCLFVESLCKAIQDLLFYVNTLEHNNLFSKRKWDNNVSRTGLLKLIYKLPSAQGRFYVASNVEANN